jgi:hypothetical protein
VYEIICGTKYCHYKYIGQTRRSVMVRFREHKSHTTNNHIQLSSVANHMKMKLNGGRRLCEYNFDKQDLKVWIVCTNQKKLDAYESILVVDKSQEKTDEQQTTNSWQYCVSTFQTFGPIFFGSKQPRFFQSLEMFFKYLSSLYIRIWKWLHCNRNILPENKNPIN